MNRPPWIENDPSRNPVNRQAAFIIRPAKEEFKPLPSDPDLTDRQTVLKYLEERKVFMETISLLKTKVNQMEKETARLRKAIVDAKKAGESKVVIELEEQTAVPADSFDRLSLSELEGELDEIQKVRERFVDNPDFSMKADLILRRIQDRIRETISQKRADAQRQTNALGK